MVVFVRDLISASLEKLSAGENETGEIKFHLLKANGYICHTENIPREGLQKEKAGGQSTKGEHGMKIRGRKRKNFKRRTGSREGASKVMVSMK